VSSQEEQDLDEVFGREMRVVEAFSPNAPVHAQARFAGRREQLRRLLGVISQRGQHAIIYGERGVGKTSIVTVLREFLTGLLEDDVHIQISRVNCDGSDTFATIWRKVFADITFYEEVRLAGVRGLTTEEERKLEDVVSKEFGPDDVRRVLGVASEEHPAVVVLDEFDRLLDVEAKIRLADTIKALSDHSVDATVLIVGVAENVDVLFHLHESIQRAIVQINVPRMQQTDLEDIVRKALTQTDLTIADDVLHEISRLSQGLPYYTHLIGQHAALAAVQGGARTITRAHLDTGIARALDETLQSVRAAYQFATTSARENMYKEVLIACALVTPDDLGYFSASALCGPLSSITNKPCTVSTFSRYLEKLCSEDRGSILVRSGQPRRYIYRFSDPLMQPYILLKALQENMMPGASLQHESQSPRDRAQQESS
jgi:AAA ATPase domain